MGVKLFFVSAIFATVVVLLPPFASAADRGITLDSRLGVAHVAGNYPDRHLEGDYLVWGGSKSYRLGFNSIEVFIPSNMCFGNNNTYQPYGPYQARDKYCEPKPSRWPLAQSLKQFVEHSDFVTLFNLPINRFYLTAYPLNLTFRQITENKVITGTPYTQAELDSLTTEYYDFAKYLLETYRNNPKVFAVMPMVTMDRWLSGRDFSQDDSPGVCNPSDSAPQSRINNMIAYYSTIAKAIQQARIDSGASQSKVYLTCEVNSVICPMQIPAVKAAINSVVPVVGCDLVGYASYELRSTAYKDPSTSANFIRQTLDYMASQTPNHPDFGNKNIVYSEVGIMEQKIPIEFTNWFVDTFIRTSLDWGMPHIQLWSLGSCATFNPGPTDQSNPNNCTGMWMFRPDGSPGILYSRLRSLYGSVPTTSSSTPTPSPSISPKPGDLNGDGSVNLHDFNQLITNFGNPYTILDFNAIISNYGS
ncbi:MAG: hypothetical protein E6P95_00775 [Candidatus Moraniibacteriota bacterium]|nr:MAG: hypothetical protein E6P95_00775 [Candidatus Moranbacteria bacterium]